MTGWGNFRLPAAPSSPCRGTLDLETFQYPLETSGYEKKQKARELLMLVRPTFDLWVSHFSGMPLHAVASRIRVASRWRVGARTSDLRAVYRAQRTPSAPPPGFARGILGAPLAQAHSFRNKLPKPRSRSQSRPLYAVPPVHQRYAARGCIPWRSLSDKPRRNFVTH